MTDNTANNKRIAKNTLLLYFRMFFMMAINLYTSRVVLNTLGVEDYGINNVVAGVISMFGFLVTSLGGASSRFITYQLGEENIVKMKETFGNIIFIHFVLAVIVLMLGETIGLWFVLHKLQIPTNRMAAALWVYQFSILSSMLTLVSIPYNAAIIAHEKMSAFAYITIVDAVLKLLIAYLLVIIQYDKLIVYSFLFFCILVFDRIVYSIYCTKHFSETRSRLHYDKNQFKEIFSFAIWTMNGNLAVIGYTQGINILLNMFFGPMVNAARGVAVQVQSVVGSFCGNFQMALNPQLTKSYAQKDFFHMHQLLKVSSKFSFFLLFIISLPLMFEAPLVLKWWLGIVPEHTVNFLRLILCSSMLIALSNPIVVSVHATGDLKKFQIIEGTMLLAIVPIAYVLLKFFRISSECVFCIHIVIEMITQYARMKIALPMIGMNVSEYFKAVILPIFKVIVLAPILPSILFLQIERSILGFFIMCFFTVISLFVLIYYVGCTSQERTFVLAKIQRGFEKINRIYKK